MKRKQVADNDATGAKDKPRKDSHILDGECVAFFIQARQKTNATAQLQQVLTAPRDFAKRYSLQISPNVEERLVKLGKFKRSFNFPPDDPINKQVIHFYNQVVIDGRYIQQWTTEPGKVAKLLKLQVPEEVNNRILQMRFSEMIDTSYITNPDPIKQNFFWIVVVIVVIILVLIPANSAYNFTDVIVDPKARDKV